MVMSFSLWCGHLLPACSPNAPTVLHTFGVARNRHLKFQTPPVTELTTSETAISYLTYNSLPNNLQCCRRHTIYHLQYNDVISYTGFVFSLNKFAYTWEISCVFRNAPCVTRGSHLAIKKFLVREIPPKMRFKVSIVISFRVHMRRNW